MTEEKRLEGQEAELSEQALEETAGGMGTIPKFYEEPRPSRVYPSKTKWDKVRGDQ